MRADELRFLYAYNRWATARILTAAAPLPAEEFLAPRAADLGSLRATLVHTYGAEWIWRRRCAEGISPAALPPEEQFPDVETLRAAWAEEEAAMRTFVESLDDEQLAGEMIYRTTSGKELSAPLWQVLLHVVNHGTQHRAEAAHLLSTLGHSPGDVDLILYVRERQAADAARTP